MGIEYVIYVYIEMVLYKGGNRIRNRQFETDKCCRSKLANDRRKKCWKWEK